MRALVAHRPAVAVAAAKRGQTRLGRPAFVFMSAVVVIQGGHVVEHIVQLVQVSLLGVPEQEALGLLGYVLQFNGTEEWLHLGYNTLYLLALYALILPLWRITPDVIPRSAFIFFITASETPRPPPAPLKPPPPPPGGPPCWRKRGPPPPPPLLAGGGLGGKN